MKHHSNLRNTCSSFLTGMLVKIRIAMNSELPHWMNLAICQQKPILYWRWHNTCCLQMLFWSPLIKPPFPAQGEMAVICLRKPLQWKAWHDNIAIKLPSPFLIPGNMLCLGQTFWNTTQSVKSASNGQYVRMQSLSFVPGSSNLLSQYF